MSWFSKKRNIAITVAAGLLAGVSIALIVYGVVTHTEPVLLEVCWVNNEARYVSGSEGDHGPCTGAEELVWPAKQLPLTVAAVTADGVVIATGARPRSSVDAAMHDVNWQVGCKVLVPTSKRVGASVVGHLGTAVEVGGGTREKRRARQVLGRFNHYKLHTSGQVSRLHCDFHTYGRIGSLRGEYLVARHELLHCLGLRHDPGNPSSAIYPFTSDDTMWERMNTSRVTDADKARLRNLYCKGQ